MNLYICSCWGTEVIDAYEWRKTTVPVNRALFVVADTSDRAHRMARNWWDERDMDRGDYVRATLLATKMQVGAMRVIEDDQEEADYWKMVPAEWFELSEVQP